MELLLDGDHIHVCIATPGCKTQSIDILPSEYIYITILNAETIGKFRKKLIQISNIVRQGRNCAKTICGSRARTRAAVLPQGAAYEELLRHSRDSELFDYL